MSVGASVMVSRLPRADTGFNGIPSKKGVDMEGFPPLTHVALTVRNLSVSVPWYGALFDADPVIDEDTDPDFHHTVYLLGNGTLIGLHQHKIAAPPERFSEYRVGLDHVAFGCEDRSELEKWSRRLDELGVDHGDIKDAAYGSGLSFRDPDGIALEFFAPPS
jgi:glyoxylase I family protein